MHCFLLTQDPQKRKIPSKCRTAQNQHLVPHLFVGGCREVGARNSSSIDERRPALPQRSSACNHCRKHQSAAWQCEQPLSNHNVLCRSAELDCHNCKTEPLSLCSTILCAARIDMMHVASLMRSILSFAGKSWTLKFVASAISQKMKMLILSRAFKISAKQILSPTL